MPTFISQVRNICKQESHPKIGEDDAREKLTDGLALEISDSTSMFLRPSDDWNPQSMVNEASFLALKVKSNKKETCC